MRRLNSTWPLLLAALTLPAALSCKKEQKEDETASAASASASQSSAEVIVPLSFQPTVEQLARADELEKSVDAQWWDFPNSFEFKPGDDQVALVIASTSASEMSVCAALLQLRNAKAGTQPTPDQLAVLEHYLKAENSRMAACAVTAAKPFISGNSPNKPLLDAVLAAGRNPDFEAARERFALLEALSGLGLRQRGSAQQLIEKSAVSLDPYVQVTALQMLFNERLGPRPDKRLEQIGLSAAKSKIPGARGLAAHMLSKVATKNSSEAPSAVMDLLKDEHPYVRAKAALALSAMKHRPALHELAKLTTDMAKSDYQYSVTAYPPPFARVLHASHWKVVADAVLTSAERLAGPELKLSPVLPNDQKGSLEKRAAEFAKWYAANKDKIDAPAAGAGEGAAVAKQDADEATSAAPKAAAPKETAAPEKSPSAKTPSTETTDKPASASKP